MLWETGRSFWSFQLSKRMGNNAFNGHIPIEQASKNAVTPLIATALAFPLELSSPDKFFLIRVELQIIILIWRCCFRADWRLDFYPGCVVDNFIDCGMLLIRVALWIILSIGCYLSGLRCG